MKKGKFRVFSVLCAVMLCMVAFSQVVFASDGGNYESDESGDATAPDAITSIDIDTEAVPMPTGDGSGAAIEWDIDAETIEDLLYNSGSTQLTPDGNLTLVDDIYQVESYTSDESELKDKQFITVQTKNGNYFYLIIDRSGDTENVYFLNMVDERDLLNLVDEDDLTDETSSAATPEPSPSPSPEPSSDSADEEEPASQNNTGGIVAVVLIVAVIGGAAVYFLKFHKPKQSVKGKSDLDEYDFGEDEDESADAGEPEPDAGPETEDEDQ